MSKFDSVWDAIEDSPEEAANMKVRSFLMSALQATIKEWEMTQAKSADRLGITQPRLNDLLKGRIEKFSLDALVTLVSHAGKSIEIELKDAA